MEEEVFNLIKSIPNINTKMPMLYTNCMTTYLWIAWTTGDNVNAREVCYRGEKMKESMRTIGDLIDTVNKLRKTTTIHYGTI